MEHFLMNEQKTAITMAINDVSCMQTS